MPRQVFDDVFQYRLAQNGIIGLHALGQGGCGFPGPRQELRLLVIFWVYS